MSSGDKVIRHVLINELYVKKKFYQMPSETLSHLCGVTEWDVDKIAVLIKADVHGDTNAGERMLLSPMRRSRLPEKVHGSASSTVKIHQKTESKAQPKFILRFLPLR